MITCEYALVKISLRLLNVLILTHVRNKKKIFKHDNIHILIFEHIYLFYLYTSE